MTQHRQGEQDRRPTAELSGLQAAGEDAETEYGERQGDREGELARHRALDVAAVDREALVEQEDRRRHCHQLGHRVAEAGQAPECPTAHRQGDQAEDHHQLEGNAVREHDVQGDDHERRHDHVEAVQREAVVPVVAPSAELEVRQEVITEVRRRHHVGAHVATGRRVVLEDEIEMDDLEHREGRTTDEDQGGEVPGDAFVGPRRIEPVSRPAQNARHDSIDKRGSGRLGAPVVDGSGSASTIGSSSNSVMSSAIVPLRHGSPTVTPGVDPSVTSAPPTSTRWR